MRAMNRSNSILPFGRLARWLFVLGLTAWIAGCGSEAGNLDAPSVDTRYTRTTPEGATALTGSVFDEIDALPYEPPSALQSDGLRFVAGQDKLARDLFLVLYESWGDPVFLDLYEAEGTHVDAVDWLLDKYGLGDPNRALGFGSFADSDLQWLFDDWSLYGAERFTQALTVGAMLAEFSIDELDYQLGALLDSWDAEFLYDALLLASRNHLRLFVWWLARYGIAYEPLYLPRSTFDHIVDTPIERGY